MRYEDLEDDIKRGLESFDRKMVFISLTIFTLVALGFFYYDFSRHSESADVITNMIESKARNNKKEALMMLAAAKAENSFAGVALFDQRGKRYFHLPADRNPNFFKNRSLIDSIFNISIERPYYFTDDKNAPPAGKIVFIYNTLPTWVAIGIGLLIIFFFIYRPGKEQLKQFILEKLRAVHENAKVKDIAGQVRHDWKSVKQGILAIAETSKGLEHEERDTLVMAINRMDGLLNDFKPTSASETQVVEKEECKQGYIHVVSELDQIVREMRISSRLSYCQEISLDVQNEALACYIDLPTSTFKRIMTNLIKNGVEAIDERAKLENSDFKGKVAVSISTQNTSAVINISDNGPGIPENDLSKLGREKFSTKRTGEGRGIYYAKEVISGMGGNIYISSATNDGACVTCNIPLPPDTPWATNHLDFRGVDEVGILDDDQDELARVRESIIMKHPSVRVRSFREPKDFRKWAQESVLCSNRIAFVDYDLNSDTYDGLLVLSDLSIDSKAYLLSNRFDDPNIQDNISQLGVGLIPKPIFSDLLFRDD